MSTINGLTTLSATNIQNQLDLKVGNDLDAGTAGEVLISGGEDQACSWGPNGVAVPNALTMGTNINLTSGNPSWDGTLAETINATDTDTTYTAGDGLDLTGTVFSTDLRAGSGLIITATELDLSAIPNSALANSSLTLGSTSISLGATATAIDDLELDACQGITMDGADIDCDCNDIDNVKDLTYCAGGSALTGGGGAGDETTATYLDLTSSTNRFPPNIPVLPSNVYETYPGTYAMAFSQSVWIPNDDSSYYNYAIEDDFTAALVAGRGKATSSSLELEAFFNIPNGWRATGILVDLRGSTGYQVSRSVTIYEVKTWSASNPISGTYTYRGGTTTNTAYTFSSTMDGAIDNALWVEVSITSTSDYIAGGYIVLTKI